MSAPTAQSTKPLALTPAPNPPHPIPRRMARVDEPDPMQGLWLCWTSREPEYDSSCADLDPQQIYCFADDRFLEGLFSR